ncbi:MAG: hypothetical protein ACF8CQ_16385 [Rhodopirellula sp. JB044]|uniref:hypothetical protein n=1 Tax=Rhodopirellula sp. JB044 TaxID=3342844 RepID=UPI00370AFA1D
MKKSELAKLHRVMPCIMLLLFALPSFGITSTVSRLSLDREAQNQAEELEERVPCAAERREREKRSLESTPCPRREFAPHWAPVRSAGMSRAIVGHRLSCDNLAPIRC